MNLRDKLFFKIKLMYYLFLNSNIDYKGNKLIGS